MKVRSACGAIFIEFTPDELENRSHTVWGFGEITEEVTFQWDLTK